MNQVDNLSPINVFSRPFIQWNMREATAAERRTHGISAIISGVPDTVHCTVSNHVEAAFCVLQDRCTSILDSHIDSFLQEDPNFNHIISLMPKELPEYLSRYKSGHKDISSDVDEEIERYGIVLPKGQYLFHGGVLKDEIGRAVPCQTEFFTARPLSTSISPEKAVLLAEHNGKAYDDNELNLNIIEIRGQATKSFVFNIKEGHEHAHEKEILFKSGLNLKITRKTYIGHKNVCKPNYQSSCGPFKKEVKIYLTHVIVP